MLKNIYLYYLNFKDLLISKIFCNKERRNIQKSLFVVNQFANTPDLPGHTRQYEVSKFLVKNGWEINIYASDFNLSKRKFTKLKNIQIFKKNIITGINWYWIRVFPYKKNNFLRYINILSFCFLSSSFLIFHLIIKSLRKDNKVIIFASSPQLPAAFLSLLIAKVFKKKFVVEIRDLWPQIYIDYSSVNKDSYFIKFLMKLESYIYRNSDKVVVLSEGSVDYVKRRGAKDVIWLPNGPSLKEFNYFSLPKETNSFSEKRPFKILYAGAHGEVNNLMNILKTASLLESFPILFVFLGDGPEKVKLIKKAESLNNVLFLDPIAKKDMPKMIASSDAVLISLKDIALFKYGVSPNKLYDAYAVGRPVISSVGGLINREIENYRIGVTAPPNSPKKLSESIIDLYTTPREDRELMSKRARALSEKIYSREIINLKYIDLLNHL